MITAKPLKRKHLGRLPKSETADRTATHSPRDSHATATLEQYNVIGQQTELNLFPCVEKPKPLNGNNIKQLLIGIVEKDTGLTKRDVWKILNTFCKQMNYQAPPDDLMVGEYLRELSRAGHILQVKGNKIGSPAVYLPKKIGVKK